MIRNLAFSVAVLALIASTATIVWSGRNLVPPEYLLRYGPTPGCRPTGETLVARDVELVVVPPGEDAGSELPELEGIRFVVIGPGCVRVGSAAGGEPGTAIGRACAPLGVPWGVPVRPSPSMPVRRVELDRAFALATREITREQYERFWPRRFRAERGSGRTAMTEISRDDASAYCAWLTNVSGLPVRLPSEAEWECAARAGTTSECSFGDDGSRLGEYGWFRENARGRPQEVATRRPNRWGLYDLHGNVWEWTSDDQELSGWWSGSTLILGPGAHPVRRGGSCGSDARDCTSASRAADPDADRYVTEFRPALTVPSRR